MAALTIRDRVVELRRVKASELVLHPGNWRRHPKAQRKAMLGVLKEIGYAGALLAREDADGKLHLIDGHLRADVTSTQEVPVLVLDVDENEARKLLAVYDPIGDLAVADQVALASLLDPLRESEDLAALVSELDAASAISEVGADGRNGMGKDAIARIVVAVSDLGRVEEAFEKTGKPTKGEALLELCEAYLGRKKR